MHLLALTYNNVGSPRSGGALRVASLCWELLKAGHNVSVIRFRKPDDMPSPSSGEMTIHDIVLPPGHDLAPVAALTHTLSRKADRLAHGIHMVTPLDVVQSDPPWISLDGARIARKLGVPHMVLSQNCETVLARQFSLNGPARKVPVVGSLLANFNIEVTRRAEKRTLEGAALVLTPSAQDEVEMASVGIKLRVMRVLPNGTGVRRLSKEERTEARIRLGLHAERPAVIFVGRMDYLPNRDAIDTICERIGPACPGVTFMLVGSNPPAIQTPANVQLIGYVESVDEYLAAADLAIVPITRGSGTRIKILDAWAAGLPVLSTSTGASGLGYTEGENIAIEDDLESFPRRIIEVLASPEKLQRLSRGALDASVPYQWSMIGKDYVNALYALAGRV